MDNVYSWVRRSLSRPVKKTSSLLPIATPRNPINIVPKYEEEELYGVTDQLIDLINSFTLDTFKNFPLQDEEGANCGDDATPKTSGNVREDLSDWQERHATLVLSKVKELSQLRFKLCPRYLKERQFWRIYFTLARNILAEYELRAVRLQKLNQMTIENENVSDTSAYEVEMSETKQATT